MKEVTVQHAYTARREVVFRAWTQAELVAQWWGPHGFTNPVCELDPRPGGKFRIHMQSPDGTIYPLTGVYEEVVAPERLVFRSNALDADGSSMFEILNTVSFKEEDGKTVVTVHGMVVSGVSATAIAHGYLDGMRAGMEQQLERLAQTIVKTEVGASISER